MNIEITGNVAPRMRILSMKSYPVDELFLPLTNYTRRWLIQAKGLDLFRKTHPLCTHISIAIKVQNYKFFSLWKWMLFLRGNFPASPLFFFFTFPVLSCESLWLYYDLFVLCKLICTHTLPRTKSKLVLVVVVVEAREKSHLSMKVNPCGAFKYMLVEKKGPTC